MKKRHPKTIVSLLSGELEKLKKDKARLDWVAKSGIGLNQWRGKNYKWFWTAGLWGKEENTPRKAIDSAMRSEKEKGTRGK